MSYRMVSGLEENLRGAVKQKIGVARKALDDSAALRKWLATERYGNIYAISGDGPVVEFLRNRLPRRRVSIFLGRDTGITVQEYASPGYPVVELELPGWVHRFNDRWWEIRDASILGHPPELDDTDRIPIESVLALLDELGA